MTACRRRRPADAASDVARRRPAASPCRRSIGVDNCTEADWEYVVENIDELIAQNNATAGELNGARSRAAACLACMQPRAARACSRPPPSPRAPTRPPNAPVLNPPSAGPRYFTYDDVETPDGDTNPGLYATFGPIEMEADGAFGPPFACLLPAACCWRRCVAHRRGSRLQI